MIHPTSTDYREARENRWTWSGVLLGLAYLAGGLIIAGFAFHWAWRLIF